MPDSFTITEMSLGSISSKVDSERVPEGGDFPALIIAQIQLGLWGAVFCFELRHGDWLILDNLAAQHKKLA
jgi:hypothetical protein